MTLTFNLVLVSFIQVENFMLSFDHTLCVDLPCFYDFYEFHDFHAAKVI
jgi:hypothetical protein